MSDITFRVIENRLGIIVEEKHCQESLGKWYVSVRDKAITEFTVNDLCKSCRQKLYLEFVVPVAIARLHQDCLAGDQYDGELLIALSDIGPEFWDTNRELAIELKALIENSLSDHGNDEGCSDKRYIDLDNDMRDELSRFSARLSSGY